MDSESLRKPLSATPDTIQVPADLDERLRLAHDAFLTAEERGKKVIKKVQKERRERRLQLGRVLIEARKLWPERGPKAKGWGLFLKARGIKEGTARDAMELASSFPADQIGTEIPSRSVIRGAEPSLEKRIQNLSGTLVPLLAKYPGQRDRVRRALMRLLEDVESDVAQLGVAA